jgi:hypothetical protein
MPQMPISQMYTVFHSKVKLIDLYSSIRLGQKGLTVTNALAYQSTELMAPVKCFIEQAPSVNSQ